MTLFVWLCKRNFTYCEQKSNLTRAILATLKLPLWICCKIYGFKAQSQPATTRAVRLAPWKRFFFLYTYLNPATGTFSQIFLLLQIAWLLRERRIGPAVTRTAEGKFDAGGQTRTRRRGGPNWKLGTAETGAGRDAERWLLRFRTSHPGTNVYLTFPLGGEHALSTLLLLLPQLWVSPRHPFITLWYYF